MRSRLVGLTLLLLGISSFASPDEEKTVSFAVLEDYDKGEDLAEIARGFELMRELGVRTLRCSFGWDDYEPEPGNYDFGWLEEFVSLAARKGISLRPYIGYTPAWGASGGDDDVPWNDPPRDLDRWAEFVGRLAAALARFPNVLSYEIYNEQNAEMWWDGDVERYVETLRRAAGAIRAADGDAEILFGGLVWPDDEWLREALEKGAASAFDVLPFHAYPETWIPRSVEDYLGPSYRELVTVLHELGEGEPIWVNEMGFATTPGRSERDQANWWARAVSTFLAVPEIVHLGIYELEDLPVGSAAIGDEANYYLGITRSDGGKKLAFATLRMLVGFFHGASISVEDDRASVTVTSGRAGELYHHLFRRGDGKRILFVYDKLASPTVSVALPEEATRAERYELNGVASPQPVKGRRLPEVRLSAGEVSIFIID